VTLAELRQRLEARAAEADAMRSSAPVADTLRLVLAEIVAVNGTSNETAAASTPDVLLTVPDAATRLAVAPRWLYAHADHFPFTVRLPGRRLRFRATGITAWLERRRP
jgi:predicted DNA-binding transcriptional regulator AlpA